MSERGVDFRKARKEIHIEWVLELLDFCPTARAGSQLRGPCPVHHTDNPKSRSFSVNLEKNSFQCFSCGAKGNQLDLYAAATE